MCTAATYVTKDHYFGRNLDLELSYGEKIAITPRNYPIVFRNMGTVESHFAIIGMAAVVDNFPLYFDGTNEEGLSMAGLNFEGNGVYRDYAEDKDNIAPFEFILWILSQCKNTDEAENLCKKINLVNTNFSENLKNTPLHWIISDKSRSIVVESVKDGLKIYDNPTGVMTNNPTFDMQLFNLNNYRHLSPQTGENRFSENLQLDVYSRGMGALGLPGDLSSASRFVRAVFVKENALKVEGEEESVGQFFHILGSVEQQLGCVLVYDDKYEYTIYSSCVNTDKGIYYYKTYGNSQITAVDIHRENLDSRDIITFELEKEQSIKRAN